MKPARIRIGLVGAGAIAQSYAQVLKDSEVAEVVGVADAREEAAIALAEHLACPSFASAEKLAEETHCEAAIVCTPPASHHEICCNLLARGIALLCEKPLSIDSASARDMLAAAEKAGVPLTMASKFRYVDDVVRTKSLVASGVLGDIVLLENSFTAQVDMSQRWNSNPTVSGGGVLIDNGTHSVDIARYLLGPIQEVLAVKARHAKGLEVEDTVRLSARTGDGVLTSIDLSWSLNKNLENYIEIYGTHGTVRVGWKESKYRPANSPDWIHFGNGYHKLDAFRRQIENFCRALRGLEPLRITAEDAMASTLVIEAAYESLRRGSWVEVGTPETVDDSTEGAR